MSGLFAPLFETRFLRPTSPWLESLGAGGSTTSGTMITERTALSDPTVYACVKLLADQVGQLPLNIVRRVSDTDRRVDRKHALFTLLHDLPNPEMTAFEMQSAMQGHLALWGNAFAEVQYNGLGQAVGLWPLRPDAMQLMRDEQQRRVWLYTLPDGTAVRWTWLNPERLPSPILHVRGFGSDGWVGYSVLALLRNAMGLSLSAAEFGARLFSNGARPGGVLQTPNKITPDGAIRMRDAWEAAHKGLSQSHRVAVLEQGVTWQQVGINPDDAQFLETRKFQVAEICRIFGVPPHMVADVERSTSWGTGIEQQQLGFLKTSLMPWLKCWTQAIARDLLTVKGWATHEVAFDLDEYLRADIKTRFDAYQLARQNGVMSANEWRAREGWEPIVDEGGDEYWRPSNYVVVGEEPPKPPEPPDPVEPPVGIGADDGTGTPNPPGAD